jgi:23S rRNA (guanosine2251-2'-O)-methyltransferase|tara:strand:- start:534 stop:1256 length:723 start_codon:yes stop_codon:yes gene_type:complete
MKEKRSFWIGGKHSVLSALDNTERKILKLFISTSNNTPTNLRKEHPEITITSSEKISKLFDDKFFMHQGYAALVETIQKLEIKDLIFHNKLPNKNVLLLDGITDVRNIGSIIRTAASQDIFYIVIEKRIFKESASLYKASSGAVEKINIVLVANISQTIAELKKNDYWITGMTGNSKHEIIHHKWAKKNAVVLGSEDNGIKKNIQSNCDFLIKIPINDSVESLNVSNACAITLFHLKNFN